MPGPYVVPGVTSNISDDFTDHLARGSAGGDDFTDGYGTRMQAIQGGTVVAVDNNPSGSGGRMVTIAGDDGTQFEELHAHQITAFRGQRRERRDELGISGASGFGQDWYYGPHIHVHGIGPDGRFSIVPYLTTTAGGGTTPFPIQSGDDMKFYSITGIGFLVVPGIGFYKSPSGRISNRLIEAYGEIKLNSDDRDNELNTVLWPTGFVAGWDAWVKAPLGVFVYVNPPMSGPGAPAGDPSPAWTAAFIKSLDDVIGDEALATAIAALDTQSDTYQADLKATLAKGLTGTVTLAPGK